MKFKSMTQRVSLLATLLAMPATYAVAQGIAVAQSDVEQEGIKLIHELESTARSVQYNAEWLTVHSRSMHTSKESHNDHLRQIKQSVNEHLNPALTRLAEIQNELPGWHQDTIDQLFVSARALAADANSAIVTQNESGSFPAAAKQEYRDFISSINRHAADLIKTSDAAGEYAKAHQQAVEAGLTVHRY